MLKEHTKTEKLLTVQQAAAFLNVSPATIRRWASNDQLRGRKIGLRGDWRFTLKELEGLVRPNSVHANTAGIERSLQELSYPELEEKHIVQFYENDQHLLRSVKEFIEAGDAAVVIATPEHRAELEDALHMAGVSVTEARERGIYQSYDAQETLAKFMVEGYPSQKKFMEVVGAIIKDTTAQHAKVHAFGEMVALLQNNGNPEGAIRLEEMWNELQASYNFALLCAYPMRSFVGEAHAASFAQICDTHTVVTPSEHYTASDAKERMRAIAILQQQTQTMQSYQLAHVIAQTIPGIVCAYNIHTGEYFYVNDACKKILGYEPEEFLQGGLQFVSSLVHPNDLGGILEKNSQALERAGNPQEPEITQFEYRIRHKNGSWRWLHTDGSVFMRRADGSVESVLNISFDITDRKNMEELLRVRIEEEPTMLEAIVQSSDDAIISKSLDGIIRTWNKGAEHIFGYTPAEAIGKHISLIIPEDRLPEEVTILSRLRKGQRIDHFDTKRKKKDGTLLDVSLTISPIKNADGEVVGASKIARDVSDRKRHEAALREEEQRKDEFLAVLAHELRNPLSPIASAAEILQLDNEGSGENREAASIIQRQVRHMVRLIDDLLDLSRIKQSKFELKKDKVDIGDVLRAAIETSHALIEGAHHRLITSFATHTTYVHGDHTRLAQIVSNLLNNAVRYTPSGGTIWLQVTQQEDRVLIVVRDSGIGIHEQTLPRIFEMFVQGKQVSGVNKGLGIGLTLVKQLVEMHGGHITAESAGAGLGSTFTVSLPVMAEPQGDADSVTHSPTQTITPQRILVVDDNTDALTSLSTMLRLQGNEVAKASDGLEAVRAAESFLPTVVLMDIGMPNMNGYEAAKRIRMQHNGHAITLIAVTGWGQDSDKQRAKEAGFDAHLTKPIDMAALSSILSSI